MKHVPKKLTFLEVALDIERYHLLKLKDEPKWTISKTAAELGRSIAIVSRYLKIASWHRTHPDKLKQCDNINDALATIEKLDRERQLRGLDDSN